LISWVQSTPQLDASEPHSVVDLGRSGVAIEATVRANPSPCPGRAPADARLWEVNGGSWTAGPGTRILFEALEDGPRTLTVVFSAQDADALSSFKIGSGRQLLDSIVLR